jgi:methylmalonyl-CoA carboxyltransferase 12S subunit
MKSDTLDISDLVKSVESLRREVAQLSDRIAMLEKHSIDRAQGVSQRSETNSKPNTISDETVLVISAAIAAFLGVKPHIRQIRLLDGAPWGQQGRVTIQASHVLSMHSG